MDTTSVYSYIDFRKFLVAWHMRAQERDPELSKSEVSRRLGLPRTRSYFTDVLAGRKVGASFVDRFVEVLGLDREEARYFRILVRYNQAETQEDRELAFDQLVGLSRIHRTELEMSAWGYYRCWWNGAIRALLATGDFDGDPKPIVQALKPAVTPGQVRESLELLRTLELIEPDSRGMLRPTTRSLTTPEQTGEVLVKQLQIQQFGLVQNALLAGEDPDRRVFTNTISISAQAADMVLDRVESFRRAVRAIVQQDPDPQDRVLQITLSLLPLTKTASR